MQAMIQFDLWPVQNKKMTNVLILTQKPEKLFWYHLWEPIGMNWPIQNLETKIPSKIIQPISPMPLV